MATITKVIWKAWDSSIIITEYKNVISIGIIDYENEKAIRLFLQGNETATFMITEILSIQ